MKYLIPIDFGNISKIIQMNESLDESTRYIKKIELTPLKLSEFTHDE